jgi:hypothetical protein
MFAGLQFSLIQVVTETAHFGHSAVSDPSLLSHFILTYIASHHRLLRVQCEDDQDLIAIVLEEW